MEPVADDRIDDLELLCAWQAGDLERGDILMRRYFLSVFRFFSSKTPGAADDLTQRTFLRCAERRERTEAIAGFRSYLFGIARRVLMDHLRSGYARERQAARRPLPAPRTATGAESAVAHAETAQVILDALDNLPLDYRVTLELHYWEQMSLKEIALATRVAEGTVKSRLCRGRALVAQRLHKRRLRRELGESTLRDLAGWSKPADG